MCGHIAFPPFLKIHCQHCFTHFVIAHLYFKNEVHISRCLHIQSNMQSPEDTPTLNIIYVCLHVLVHVFGLFFGVLLVAFFLCVFLFVWLVGWLVWYGMVGFFW